MTSFSTSHRIDLSDPEEVRQIVAAGQRKGLISKAPAPGPKTDSNKFDPAAIRRIVEEAKASGALTSPISILDPATIARIGADVLTTTGVVSQWIDVDPGTAAHWLQNNFVNRPLVKDVVDAYARDMANGNWTQTHQGVAFNDLDHLIDGQHRLSAIVKSGATVRMMVTFGLPAKIKGKEMTTMDCVDRGRTRSVADQLKIQHGMKNGSIIASLSASLGAICYNVRTRRLSVGQTLEIYRAFQPSVDFMIASRPSEHGLKMIGVLSAFAFAMQGAAEPAVIRTMFQDLCSGNGLFNDMPLCHLRNFLLSDDAKLLNRGMDRGIAELTLQAIFLQYAGESISELKPSLDGMQHFRALQPERVAAIADIFKLP
jgi:hypothetical protein